MVGTYRASRKNERQSGLQPLRLRACRIPFEPLEGSTQAPPPQGAAPKPYLFLNDWGGWGGGHTQDVEKVTVLGTRPRRDLRLVLLDGAFFVFLLPVQKKPAFCEIRRWSGVCWTFVLYVRLLFLCGHIPHCASGPCRFLVRSRLYSSVSLDVFNVSLCVPRRYCSEPLSRDSPQAFDRESDFFFVAPLVEGQPPSRASVEKGR